MNAIHINWTKPFTNKTNRPYETEDFEILTTILSALKWREKNGKITMVTDKRGAEYYLKSGLHIIWDGINACLDDIDVNPDVFWAAGKIFALSLQSAPIAMIDTDFIVWDTIDAGSLPDAAVIHFEDLYPDIYPPKEYFRMSGYEFDAEFDWTLKACNTALCIIKDESLLRYYTEQSIKFMRGAQDTADRLKYMVFAEQRLLSMCAAGINKTVCAFSDLPTLFKGGDARFTHTWGMKQQMRDNDRLRFDFCMRCIRRVINDYPYMEDVMRGIYALKRYF